MLCRGGKCMYIFNVKKSLEINWHVCSANTGQNKGLIFCFNSVQFSCSVMSDSLQPRELQHASLPVHQQLPEFTQTHVHWVGDAIQLSHPLSSPSPPTLNLSQHQGLFKWVSSSQFAVSVFYYYYFGSVGSSLLCAGFSLVMASGG